MLKMTFSLKNVEEVMKRLEQVSAEVAAAEKKQLYYALQEEAEWHEENDPKQSGLLAGSWRVYMNQYGGSLSNKTRYAPYVIETGTRPHAISNAFGHHNVTIEHPGTKANPAAKGRWDTAPTRIREEWMQGMMATLSRFE